MCVADFQVGHAPFITVLAHLIVLCFTNSIPPLFKSLPTQGGKGEEEREGEGRERERIYSQSTCASECLKGMNKTQHRQSRECEKQMRD